jgi:hypothetical protein
MSTACAEEHSPFDRRQAGIPERLMAKRRSYQARPARAIRVHWHFRCTPNRSQD